MRSLRLTLSPPPMVPRLGCVFWHRSVWSNTAGRPSKLIYWKYALSTLVLRVVAKSQRWLLPRNRFTGYTDVHMQRIVFRFVHLWVFIYGFIQFWVYRTVLTLCRYILYYRQWDRQYSTWPSSSGSAVVPCRAAGARRSRCQVMCVEQESQLSQISAGCALCCVL